MKSLYDNDLKGSRLMSPISPLVYSSRLFSLSINDYMGSADHIPWTSLAGTFEVFKIKKDDEIQFATVSLVGRTLVVFSNAFVQTMSKESP